MTVSGEYAQLVLSVAILGALEVIRDGERVPVPRGKTSEIVVRLALQPGEVVRADRIVEDLWTADGTNARRNTLQSKVAMLRRALGDPDAITSRDGGYALTINSAHVDALVVLGSTATVTALLNAGDARGAAGLCASALSLYRGDILQDAGDGEWATPHRTRLEEARVETT